MNRREKCPTAAQTPFALRSYFPRRVKQARRKESSDKFGGVRMDEIVSGGARRGLKRDVCSMQKVDTTTDGIRRESGLAI